MSSNSTQRQSRPVTILPSIVNLIDAADAGLYRQHPQHQHGHYQQGYPPTPPGHASMYDHNIQLPSLACPSQSRPRSRSGNDPAYPTPPGSARSDRGQYPAQAQGTTGGAGANGAGSRRHVCQYCNQAFDRPSSLQTHMHTHTGEQPHICPYQGCGRAFSVRSNMRRHFSTHEQPRMTDADADDSRGAHDMRNCEYGVFSVSQQRR